MDNRWQLRKCGSTWQSSAEPAVVVAPSPAVSQVQPPDSSRNLIIGSSQYSYPHIVQEPSSSTRKTMPDPLFQTTNFNLHNSNLSVLGTPFFTLLSGPPSFPQYDSQHLLSSKPVNSSSKVNIYNSNSTVGPTEHDSSFVTPKRSLQNIDNRYMKSKTDINYLTSDGIRQPNGFSSLKAAPVSGSVPAQHCLPRVFCLYASGDLFFSNGGLLGVVCSCHGFHMSISKFSEHSGLRDVNPGDAVHMDSGETIAQWRRIYFSKFGIKIPEDQHGWNWPEGLSTVADSAKSKERVHNVTKSSNLRPFANMVLPNDHQLSQHLVNEVKSRVSSNIELRLGQPSQQSQTGFNTRVSRVSHPVELISSQPLIYNGSNRITEKSKQVVNCAVEAAKSGSTRGQNGLGFSNLGFGSYSSMKSYQHEQLKNDVVTDSVNSMLFSHLESAKIKMQNKDSQNGANNQFVESRISKFSSMNFGSGYMESYKLMEREKGVDHVDHGFSRPVTSRHVSPKPPLMSGSPSMVMNSSTNMNSIISKDEAAKVPNYPLNESLRTSINPESKLTEKRDVCKVNLPEFVTKSLHSGTENTAVISVSADKCSCWVHKEVTTENSNPESKKFLSAFGEPSQITSPILSTSNLEKDCNLHDKSISINKIGETMKPNLKKVEFNAFQWKDVPSKMSERCHVPCTDQTANFLEEKIDIDDQTSDVPSKSVDQPVLKVDFMKEQVMSNISSKCSAPAFTQTSVRISNEDSCTDDAQNTDCAKNFVLDESSGIQKSWSSDDDFDFKINSKRSKSVCDRSTRSLVDELRVIDNLRLKKVQNQVNTVIPGNTSSMKTIEKNDFTVGKRKRETKFKILGTSFPESPVSPVSSGSFGQSGQSGQSSCMEDMEKFDKRNYNDFLEIPESSRGKKARVDLEFSKEKNFSKRFSRPIVCGKYGLISNGDTSKPAKIYSLGKILKTAKRFPSSGNKLVKKSQVKQKTLKKSIIREGNRRSGRTSNLKENKYKISKQTAVYSSDDDSMKTSDDDDSMKTSDDDFGAKIKKKSKATRKRSIYELITEGNDSGCAQDNLKTGGTSNNNLDEIDNKSRYPEDTDLDKSCNVCGSLNNDEINCLLECNRCFIKVHQACYGISKVPKSHWYCRPCRENATNMVCVLCGYEGGVMTRAVQSSNVVKGLLNTWNVVTESQYHQIDAPKNTIFEHIKASSASDPTVKNSSYSMNNTMVLNSVTAGFFDRTVKQWVHMVCGLWTPGTRCPNVDTMSAFDVSGACFPKENVVCSICRRGGGCCIRCRVINCAIHFHPWCAHQKGLLQSEVEGAENDKVGFYGRCELHATKDHFNPNTKSLCKQVTILHEKDTCARTEGYKGRKQEGFRHDNGGDSGSGCMVRQEQVDAWNHINRQLLFKKRLQRNPQPVQDVEHDFRKEYGRYKQSKGWKHLVVYKSGIHALGLYTSIFISQNVMVVEYVGEIVGLRVADRREKEYQSGKQLQYKSACYFFKIDKEHIIDATRKGGIARFVNHSCQPNCVARVITVRGEKKVVFFAERDIYPGEEITYDYHFNNEDEAKKIFCSCNSSHCRRFLN